MSLPDPLTPVDCDLRDFAFMPLDTTRLLDSDLFAIATGDEFKAAITLWCKAWQQVPAGSLPKDERVLAHLSGAGPKWKKVRAMALRGFVECSDGRLYHPTVCEKANDSWSKKLSYRERSKKGNSKRWGSQKDGEQHSNSDPNAIPQGLPEPPKGQYKGEGEYSVTNVTASDEISADPEKVMFDSGVRLLGNAGTPPAKARPLLGKWKRDHGSAKVIAALGAAQREGAIDPVSFIEARWRSERRQASGEDGWAIGGTPMSSPC